MARFVYRPDHPEADDLGMVDVSIAPPKHASEASFQVITDEMPTTRHMADGRYYTSKHRFREATRAAGCVEVGNETSAVLKPRRRIPMDRGQRVRDIRQAIEQLRSR